MIPEITESVDYCAGARRIKISAVCAIDVSLDADSAAQIVAEANALEAIALAIVDKVDALRKL